MGSGIRLLSLLHSPACQGGQAWKEKSQDQVHIWSASSLRGPLFASVPLAGVTGSNQRTENPRARLSRQEDREKTAFQPEHEAAGGRSTSPFQGTSSTWQVNCTQSTSEANNRLFIYFLFSNTLKLLNSVIEESTWIKCLR